MLELPGELNLVAPELHGELNPPAPPDLPGELNPLQVPPPPELLGELNLLQAPERELNLPRVLLEDHGERKMVL